MSKPTINILITGSDGQLGFSMESVVTEEDNFNLALTTRNDLDITDPNQIGSAFLKHQPDYVLNFAAYTAVDKAEEESELAFKINSEGARNLAKASSAHNAKLIHVSTDYVFSGESSDPYKESDKTGPISVYGDSKHQGEKAILEEAEDSLIIRTSWLYSEFKANFFKSMLRLSAEREELKIVSDQIGSPTYAVSLAVLIREVILKETSSLSETSNKSFSGIYHFSNEGVASWYDFARAIILKANPSCKVLPIMTKDYPTPAKRPKFSLMDKTKLKEDLGFEIKHWQDDLNLCFERLVEEENLKKVRVANK